LNAFIIIIIYLFLFFLNYVGLGEILGNRNDLSVVIVRENMAARKFHFVLGPGFWGLDESSVS
jgi:hypothetical protein